MNPQDTAFSVENAEESSGFLLWQVTNIWQREIKKILSQYGLTHSQFVLLASVYWLSLHSSSVTQIMLSGHTKIDPMTTSTVLRTLEQKNYITRSEHETDTRAKVVLLTKNGEDLTRKLIPIIE